MTFIRSDVANSISTLVAVLQQGWALVASRTLPALGLTLAFAFVAYGVRAVTASGAIAGAAVTFMIFLAAGAPGFLAVMMVFVLTTVATRFGYVRKQELGTAEPRAGRKASQVLANLLAAAMVAAPAALYWRAQDALYIAMAAALAEAAADTVSSEIGQALRRPAYLITNLRSAPIGDNGGISVAGSVAGIMAAVIIAFTCEWLRLVDFRGFLIATLAAIFGMFFDSLLGATLERPGRLGNDSVNFLSTVFAACLALAAVLILS
ncbi:MAG TPA: DUF92 domain-containing protein [Clostridia bacterium]|nr:DUF92 domain-containing protein [Clostridia bacterium]